MQGAETLLQLAWSGAARRYNEMQKAETRRYSDSYSIDDAASLRPGPRQWRMPGQERVHRAGPRPGPTGFLAGSLSESVEP
jgi:hypothetical protein